MQVGSGITGRGPGRYACQPQPSADEQYYCQHRSPGQCLPVGLPGKHPSLDPFPQIDQPNAVGEISLQHINDHCFKKGDGLIELHERQPPPLQAGNP